MFKNIVGKKVISFYSFWSVKLIRTFFMGFVFNFVVKMEVILGVVINCSFYIEYFFIFFKL